MALDGIPEDMQAFADQTAAKSRVKRFKRRIGPKAAAQRRRQEREAAKEKRRLEREAEKQRKKVTLADGSSVTFSNLRGLPDWQCGSRKSATFEGGDVVLYFDRSGCLVSANIPAAGNAKFYERDPSRSCLKNWHTGKFELLTNREYKRYEKKAGMLSK